jgi:hypothetical protein
MEDTVPFNNEMSISLAIICLVTILAAMPGCSSLPLDGSAIGALRKDDTEACSCEVEVTCH